MRTCPVHRSNAEEGRQAGQELVATFQNADAGGFEHRVAVEGVREISVVQRLRHPRHVPNEGARLYRTTRAPPYIYKTKNRASGTYCSGCPPPRRPRDDPSAKRRALHPQEPCGAPRHSNGAGPSTKSTGTGKAATFASASTLLGASLQHLLASARGADALCRRAERSVRRFDGMPTGGKSRR